MEDDMAGGDQDDEQGYEGDVSDHAGDRLGGAIPKQEIDVSPEDMRPTPEG